jgi:hypothetical protein
LCLCERKILKGHKYKSAISHREMYNKQAHIEKFGNTEKVKLGFIRYACGC